MKDNLKVTAFFGLVGYLIFRAGKKIMTNDNEQIEYMARTMWGEARGEGVTGMRAVGHVIMNRVKAGSWYGATPKDVVLKKWQFSCWNENDPNRTKLLAVTTADNQYSTALSLAKAIYAGTMPDITNGATNYLALGSLASVPSWASRMKQVASIGNHTFYA